MRNQWKSRARIGTQVATKGPEKLPVTEVRQASGVSNPDEVMNVLGNQSRTSNRLRNLRGQNGIQHATNGLEELPFHEVGQAAGTNNSHEVMNVIGNQSRSSNRKRNLRGQIVPQFAANGIEERPCNEIGQVVGANNSDQVVNVLGNQSRAPKRKRKPRGRNGPQFATNGPEELPFNEVGQASGTNNSDVVTNVVMNVLNQLRPHNRNQTSRGENEPQFATNGPEELPFNEIGQAAGTNSSDVVMNVVMNVLNQLRPPNRNQTSRGENEPQFATNGSVDLPFNNIGRAAGTSDSDECMNVLGNQTRPPLPQQKSTGPNEPQFATNGPEDLPLIEIGQAVGASDSDESMNVLGNPSSSPKHKGKSRGPNKPPQFATNGPEKLPFNEIGQAYGPRKIVAKFSRFIGHMVQDPTRFPINVLDFKEFSKGEEIEKAWNTFKECIDWSDPSMLKMQSKIRRTLWRKLNDRWRGFKARLKKKYYTPYVGTEQRFTCPDERVINDQWRDLVAWWDGDGQKYSVINKKNRSRLKLYHTTGTMTFAQVRYEWSIEHPGEELDRLTFFKLVHSKKVKDRRIPLNAEVQKAFDEFDNLEKSVCNEGREITTEVRNELFTEYFGPERRNTVRGYGVGAEWRDIPGIVTEQRAMNSEVQALKAALEEQRVAAAAEMERMKMVAEKREEALRAEYKAREERILNKLDAIEARVNSNNNNNQVGQILAAGLMQSVPSFDMNAFINALKLATGAPGQ